MIEVAVAVFAGCCIIAFTIDAAAKRLARVQERQALALFAPVQDIQRAAQRYSLALDRASQADEQRIKDLYEADRLKLKADAAIIARKVPAEHSANLRAMDNPAANRPTMRVLDE